MSRLRRIKPRLSDDELNSYDELSEYSPPEQSTFNDGSSQSYENDINNNEARATLSRISFGSLVKAQSSLERDREQPSASGGNGNDVQQLRNNSEKHIKKHRDELKRTSKNAPQEMSSRYAVTRRREIVAPKLDPVKLSQDPRFDAAVNHKFDEKIFRKNYSFLDDYRNSEMKLLKAELVKTKDPFKREKLAQKIKSMESQQQTQRNKDKNQEVLRTHKKKEREMVKMGKKEFHLKKSAVKTLVLTEEFSKLNEKQLQKTMERKEKRKAQKERKNMPFARRDGTERSLPFE
ncbi:hypothetical protein EDC01DRAFT_646307 [Geopyxis carbonaria]|nr:hypothetical protein EDC01DRAFT_646307 [Geopyxis carbonaria]